MFLTDTLANIWQNIFAYFPFQNILHLFLFLQKKTPFLVGDRGLTPPPPFTDQFATNWVFWTPSLKLCIQCNLNYYIALWIHMGLPMSVYTMNSNIPYRNYIRPPQFFSIYCFFKSEWPNKKFNLLLYLKLLNKIQYVYKDIL